MVVISVHQTFKMFSINHNENKIRLVKEKNIKLRIDGNVKKPYKVVFYKIEDCEGKNSSECIYDPDLLYTNWNCAETLSTETYPNKILISIISENGWFSDIVYDNETNQFYQINITKDEDVLNKVKSPIIITGPHGGGTSYVAKLLKFRGLYFGTDSGNLFSRKPHESITFVDIQNSIIFYKGGRLSWQSENDVKKIKDLVNRTPFFYSLSFKKQLTYKFKNFWGNVPFDLIWAWKHPVTSIVLPIWKNIFPSSRLIIISRNKERISKNIFDQQGDWFRKEASDKLLEHYFKPDISNFLDSEIFNCNFNRVVKDIDHMNELLSWIGLEPLSSKNEYISLLKESGYEGDMPDEI